MTDDVVDNPEPARLRDAERSVEDVVENLALMPKFGQPGFCGNRNGPPRKKLISQAYRKTLQSMDPNDPENRTFAEMIALAMCRAAASGDVAAAREIREVTEGKTPHVVQVDHNETVTHILSDATEEELELVVQTFLEDMAGGTILEGVIQ